jgi:tRNA (guanine37-N1)-methyltransferase
MRIEILTLFPEMFPGVLNSSMMKRAQESGRVEIRVRNIRDYTTDKHHVTDDTQYGGGPGMVMKPEPLAAAFDAVIAESAPMQMTNVYLSPQGEQWNQRLAEEFSRLHGIILLCGHYEGIDERVRALYIDREISVGDFVLTGGELPAMIVVDSIVRLIPGVLGNEDSIAEESFGAGGLLDHPHYTRPEDFRGMKVPDVLLSGHHKNIAQWRRLEALKRTIEKRPDLLNGERESLTRAERELVETLLKERHS